MCGVLGDVTRGAESPPQAEVPMVMGELEERPEQQDSMDGGESSGSLQAESEHSSWFGGVGQEQEQKAAPRAATPGKHSGIEAALGGAGWHAAFGGRESTPGKQTLAMMAESAMRHVKGAEGHAGRLLGRAGNAAAHAAAGVAGAVGAHEMKGAPAAEPGKVASGKAEAQPLEGGMLQRMGRLFGANFSDVKVFAGSHEATGSTRALARDREIHFREGAYEPNTAHGESVIAHELAHLVQLGGGQGKAGERKDLEREADSAAGLVSRGEFAPVMFAAPSGTAYAYSDGE